MDIEKPRKYVLADINGHEPVRFTGKLKKPDALTAHQEFIIIANGLFEQDPDFVTEVTSITHKSSLCGNCNSDKTHAMDKIDARKRGGNFPALARLDRPYAKYRDWLANFRSKNDCTRQDILRLTVEAAQQAAMEEAETEAFTEGDPT